MSEQTHNDDQQQRIAALVRSLDAPAPASLHRQVQALVADRRGPRSVGGVGRRLSFPGLVAAGATVAVAVAVAVAIGLSGGPSQTPSVREAATPTLRAATLPAPPQSATRHAQLVASVDGVPFPYWGERFGWRASGARADRIDGRPVTTVFYADDAGRRIGYAILGGGPAPRIEGGVSVWREGVRYRLLSENGAAAVVWMRDGHLCVVSGHGVSGATLLRLASWSDATVS